MNQHNEHKSLFVRYVSTYKIVVSIYAVGSIFFHISFCSGSNACFEINAALSRRTKKMSDMGVAHQNVQIFSIFISFYNFLHRNINKICPMPDTRRPLNFILIKSRKRLNTFPFPLDSNREEEIKTNNKKTATNELND